MFTPRDRKIPQQPQPNRPPQPQAADKPTICTTGTYVQKLQEAIKFSEDKRKRVTQLGRVIGDKARNELLRRHQQIGMRPPSQADLDTKADAEIEADARWRTAAADEQWGYRLAVMYGTIEIMAAANQSNELTRALIVEQQETNRLLRRLLDATMPDDGFRGPAYDEPI